MAKKLSMLQTANTNAVEVTTTNKLIKESLTALAAKQGVEPQQLYESVTHVLANIASTASDGKPIQLLHTNSVAAFFAGVERLANVLPNMDEPNKSKGLRLLTTASVGPDGHVTYQVAKIAELGARDDRLYKSYLQMVTDYVTSVSRGQPNGEPLAQAARQLQMNIDRAMRASPSANKSQPTNVPSTSQ